MKKTAVVLGSHYVIEGRKFASVAAVLMEAKKRGYTGGATALKQRLHRYDTWDKLLNTMSLARSESAKRAAKKRRKPGPSEDVMAAINAVEARKAAIKAREDNEERQE